MPYLTLLSSQYLLDLTCWRPCVCRPLAAKHLGQLAAKARGVLSGSTLRDYDKIINVLQVRCTVRSESCTCTVAIAAANCSTLPNERAAESLGCCCGLPLLLLLLQRWVAADGYTGGRRKQQVKPVAVKLGHMPDNEVTNLLTRFFEWYVVDGRPGDPAKSKGGKKVRHLTDATLQQLAAGCRRGDTCESIISSSSSTHMADSAVWGGWQCCCGA